MTRVVFDPFLVGVAFAAAWVGIGLANLCIWRVRRRTLGSAAARSVLGRFILIDTLVQATFWGLLFAAATTGLWPVLAVVIVGIAKMFVVDWPLERWRDERIAACDGALPPGDRATP